MSQEDACGTDRCEPMAFRLGHGTVITAWLPAGALPTAKLVLDMVAPLDRGWNRYTRRTCPDCGHWTVPEDVSLAATAVLPHRTHSAVLAVYPGASEAARAHVAKALHDHCAAELEDFEESALLAAHGMPPVGFSAGAAATHVANTVAARHILDAALGPDTGTRERDGRLGCALYHYEHGRLPDPAAAKALDARMRAVGTLPETDYLAAGHLPRERAMAYLLVRLLSTLDRLPAPGLAPKLYPIDHTTAFACTQLHDPARYARTARLLGTLDPDVLRPVLCEYSPE